MKRLLVALAFVMVTSETFAITRYNSTSMSCAKVQATIVRDGAAIMRWKSTRNGLPLYGRRVSRRKFLRDEHAAAVGFDTLGG